MDLSIDSPLLNLVLVETDNLRARALDLGPIEGSVGVCDVVPDTYSILSPVSSVPVCLPADIDGGGLRSDGCDRKTVGSGPVEDESSSDAEPSGFVFA
jgi:hypothetical protein